MNSPPLPDVVAKAIGRILADLHAEWRKDVERIGAESRAIVAELRAEVLALKADLKSAADGQAARVDEALARVKDGEPGLQGPQGVQGPAGERGEPGVPGATGERGEPGEKGEPGEIGPQGPQGASGAAGRDAEPLTPEMVAEAVLSHPDAILEAVKEYLVEHPPKDGAPGPAGERGEPGQKGDAGERGPEGPAGKDGLDVVNLLIDRSGELVVTWSDGQTRSLGPVVGKDGAAGRDGKDGAPGKDGRDGISFDNLAADYDGERTVTVFAVKGEERREIGTLLLPIPIDRGVYKAGEKYQRGDVVSYGGSIFTAQVDTDEKPEGGKGWRLAVKRGRDGRDGKDGERGPQGPKGDPGLHGNKL